MSVVDFPDEWATGDPIDQMGGPLKGTEHICLAGILLDDGANLWAVVYPGGHRFARTAHQIGWGIEERYGGKPPRQRDLARVNAVWRDLLSEMAEAGRKTDADMIKLGLPPSRPRDSS